jgi:Zn-dependent M28 family amino/carboxypeptidase
MNPRFRAVPPAAIAGLALLLWAACEAPNPVVATRHKQVGAATPSAGLAADGRTTVLAEEPTGEVLREGTWDAKRLLGHIELLASNEFEGRGPGTHGEELTVAYLTGQFQAMGLEPGNPDGTFVQSVPLIGFTARPMVQLRAADTRVQLEFPRDYVAVSRHFEGPVEIDGSDLLFVGYGVIAPEYDWNDYKDVDVRGKTLVILINDPAVPDPNDPTQLDPNSFKGWAMTYYGRWTYKYEIASRLGAKAAFIVHETEAAGYPYEVVEGSWSRENFDIDLGAEREPRVAIEGWLRQETAEKIFKNSATSLAQLKLAARQKDFRPVPLAVKLDARVENELRHVRSRNVVAKWSGEGPYRDEFVVYTAHWDHLGRDDGKKQGDAIFNGALDNASGIGGMLEIARAFTQQPKRPARSILFLATTAEEKGLLGSKFYAENPLYPLEHTLANVNMDGLNAWGPTKDLIVIGMGQSTLEDLLAEEARDLGRELRPDAEPEKGFYYRSDHFEFAKRGVPALHFDSGEEYIGKEPGYGRAKKEAYTANDYHKPSDEVRADWDLTGAVEDLRLFFRLGLRVAKAKRWPEWKPGTEFEGVRKAALAGTDGA